MPFMPVMTKKKPPDGLGAREKFFSGYVRLSAARHAQAIPSPARPLVVKRPLADRFELSAAPNRELIASAVGIFIEDHHHARWQIPLERCHLIRSRADALGESCRL